MSLAHRPNNQTIEPLALLQTRRNRANLTIEVASGVGRGPTTIAAFDGALREAGVHNYNLIRLSSVVPPGSDIQVLDRAARPTGDWGDRLYVVYAAQYASEPGEEAWAGVGWVQQEGTRKGLFVEHEGPTEAFVRGAIGSSLDSLVAGRREDSFGDHHTVLRGAVCEGEHTCALVVAVFESASWGQVIDLN